MPNCTLVLVHKVASGRLVWKSNRMPMATAYDEIIDSLVQKRVEKDSRIVAIYINMGRATIYSLS